MPLSPRRALAARSTFWPPTLVLSVVLLAPAVAALGGELSAADFSFNEALGSEGARIEKLGPGHFRVILAPAPGHPEWSNMLQFVILRNAKGSRLRLDLGAAGNETGMRSFCSWSYDGKHWRPIRRTRIKEGTKTVTALVFPEFTEDRVLVGGEVPMSYEDHVALLRQFEKHPHATLHRLGKSPRGRELWRLTVTDPGGPHPIGKRWVHHVVNQHCYEYNAQWRIVGMIRWLLSDEGADCRKRQICHFVVMMNVDGPSAGYGRVNTQGIDMNRSYSAGGTDQAKQAREAYLVQKDMEALMASGPPITTTWSMHTWSGPKVEIMLRPGPEMGASVGAWTELRDAIRRNDTRGQFKPLRVLTSPLSPTHWCSGTHKQFGLSAFCCEGGGDIYSKEETLRTGAVLMKSLAEYYRGTRP